MPLSKAREVLLRKGHLKPLEQRPLPDPIPPKHDQTKYYAYHQQTGHDTDSCFRLRHDVQDLDEPPADGAQFTPDVAYGMHCFEHLRMLVFVLSDLGIEGKKVRYDQKEACEARSEAPLELGAKNVRCARRAKDESLLKLTKIGKNTKSPKGGKKKVLLKDGRVPIHNTRGKFSPPLDGLLHHQRTTTTLLDLDDFRISKPFDMDKATLLPLRGSLGRKPGRATQAKLHTVLFKQGKIFHCFGSEVVHLKSKFCQNAESSLILQVARYQAKCEARTGMEQDIPFPHLDRSNHVQTPQ
ncbi:hypothetical protein CsSME_00040639 [Camellia sinensis var. sinensis]